MRRRPQQRAELCLEDWGMGETESNAPQTGASAALALRKPARVERRIDKRIRQLPLAQVRVGEIVEHFGNLVERPLDGPFRVDPLLANDRGRAADEQRIVEQQ